MSILADHLELDPFFHTKICRICKKEKPIEEFHKHIRYKDNMDSRCKVCRCKKEKQVRVIHKTAPPKPDVCECCFKVPEKWHLDHDHKTNKFRGWLCEPCNIRLGLFGDSIKGLNVAINYLEMAEKRAMDIIDNIGGIA